MISKLSSKKKSSPRAKKSSLRVDRPFVSLKLATSLDGKIALANGESKWITSEHSRAKGRALRAEHDGICVGSNTAVQDDPSLTTRIEGKPDPLRIVYDSRLRLSSDSQLARTAGDTPVVIFSREKPPKTLKELGIKVFDIPATDNGLDLKHSLLVLGELGVHSLLVEGGGTLAASFLREGLIDRIHWFRAPLILGGDGRNCIGDMAFSSLDMALRFQRQSHEMIGPDTYEILERVS